MRPRLHVRILARAVGNVLLGASLGLLFYYAITDAVSRNEQQVLLESAAELGSMGAASPDRMLDESEPGVTGWETWLEEDIEY